MSKAHYFASSISKLAAAIIFQLVILCNPVYSGNQSIQNSHVSIISSNSQSISLIFEPGDVAVEQVVEDGNATNRFSLPNEGHTNDYGFPQLPSVTRIVVVPPSAGLNFTFETGEPRIVQSETPPMICKEAQASNIDRSIPALASTYPPVVAQMSEPFIIRGVRMVKVTTYPVRFDPKDNTYMHYDNIETEVHFTDAEPVNPVHNPIRRNRSQEFLKFIDAFALNGSDISRDDPGRDLPDIKPGHYLVVSHEACLEFVAPFIEWRRKGGYKVDIQTFNQDEANNSEIVFDVIQERYNAYIEQGVDPFDHILLVGDRSRYDGNIPDAQWILEAMEGETVWGMNGDHADYLYACLEGNDEHMDAAISRFPAGNPETLELVVRRTLSYEAEPFMDDPTWFNKGAVFTQHSGNNERICWTPYMHTSARWSEEALRKRGFDDVATYEDMAWDRQGDRIFPFLRDVYNEGRNVLTGIAQNYRWRNGLEGLENNVVFPIHLSFAERTGMMAHILFRTGNGENLMGPVVTTGTWGNYSGLEPLCVQWMGLVSAFVNHDLTFGWSRVYAVTDLESYFPNIEDRNHPLYSQTKTDFDFMGDPGIQAWIGVPRLVEAQISLAELSATTSYVEVIVTNTENDEPVSGAKVSLYAPGDMPEFDDAGYADYDEMWQMTSISDEDGRAVFSISEEIEFVPGTQLNYTVTGRDIRPFFGDVEIEDNPASIEAFNFDFAEIEGNGDDEMNPGESFVLRFTATNISEEENINGVTVIISSASEWIEVDENEIDLGDIAAGEEIVFEQGVNFALAVDCPDGMQFPGECPLLQVEFTSGDMTWDSAVEIDPVAPAFAVNAIVGGAQIPFNVEELDIEIENIGRMEAGALTAELRSGSRTILVLQNEVEYPNIGVGELAQIEGNLLQINVNPQTIPGIIANMMLTVSTENGFNQQIPFTVRVEGGEGDFPQAPDNYGYICFDDTDEDWDMAPDYEWIEISLEEDERDFNGELLAFEGESEFDIGEAIVIDLPFEIQFYGEDFEQITVCTKGFIAMGDQPRITNYQPSPLDRAIGGGTGMIAPFWGDITFLDNTGVYSFYDEDNARFIIEWYEFSYFSEDADFLTFQVIFYDPEVWITQTGDPNILFQYLSISDLRNLRDVEWLQAIPHAAVGISSPDGTTGINYSFNNTLPESSAPLEAERAILFSTGFEYRVGRLFGTVTDFETGEPIPGAGAGGAVGDENGEWEIPEVIAEVPFSITCSVPGYNDSTLVGLIVEEGGELEINFALLHPEFECSIDDITVELEVNGGVNVPFEISNNGNGSLEWETEYRWLGGGDFEPWELTRQYPIGDILDDSRLQGVVFVNDRFYVAGSNNRRPQIYVLNRDGEQMEQFDQFGPGGGYGHKDLAFDGEWIWGSGTGDIYAFTPEGELMGELNGPFNPNNNIAWDFDRELLWISSTTSNILAIDRQGNQIMELNRMGLRVYGLSYFPEDPDGFPLYIFHKDAELGDQLITKMNPETNDTMFVTILEPEDGGTPAASFCTNQYDILSWVFMCVTNSGPNDRIDIWQIANRFEWFELEPADGRVDAGESQELVAALDATGIPEDFRFELDMIFHHNAIEGEFVLPVSLDVIGENRGLQIELRPGWNMISVNVEPEDLDVREIMRPLVENDLLLLLKNGAGEFYSPAQNFSNIDGWVVAEGYQLNVRDAARLDIRGAFIPADQPIALREGWNISAYFPRQAVNAEVALAGIADNLIIAKDGLGRFYLPEFGFINMGDLRAGQGYQYNMLDADELIYQIGEQVALAVSETSEPEHFGVLPPTGTDMSILLTGNPQMSHMEIGIFNPGGRLVGSGVFNQDGNCGIAVWGDDLTTDEIDGAVEGEDLTFVLWNGANEFAVSPIQIMGEPIWTDGGFMASEISSVASAPVTFGIHETYPNPTNGPVRLLFGLEMDAKVSLRVYDLSGRLVTTLASGNYKTGNHQVVWNTAVVSSGLYIVKLAVPGNSHIEKIAVLK
ncbi:MAG: T9SS type A sorting domain-containing protein [Calditrichaeota bacterium]|nr:T9SS type A sorting domain-containing protein [Calditrichota bacterium]